MEIKNVLIGFLLFVCVFVAFTNFHAESSDNLGITYDNSKTSKYTSQLNNMTDDFNTVYSKVQNVTSDNDAQFFTGVWNAVQIGIATVKTTGTSIGIGFTMITDLGTDLGWLPSWVPQVAIGILVLVVAMLIIGWILRKEKT